jgi:hypothetical protein
MPEYKSVGDDMHQNLRDSNIWGITLEHLIRYFLSGGALIITYMYLNWGKAPLSWNSLSKIANLPLVATVSGMSVLSGLIIYSIHRAIIIRFFDIVLEALILKKIPICHIKDREPYNIDKMKWFLFLFQPSRLEAIYDLHFWVRRSESDPMQANLQNWATSVHFLYCISWAILIGIELPLMNVTTNYQIKFCNLLIIVCILLLCAIASHSRFFWMSKYVYGWRNSQNSNPADGAK